MHGMNIPRAALYNPKEGVRQGGHGGARGCRKLGDGNAGKDLGSSRRGGFYLTCLVFLYVGLWCSVHPAASAVGL